MKRKQLLTKTFLAVVMLCVGMSVWATDVVVNTTDNFNYNGGTCLNETYTDGGSTAKDAIGILQNGGGNNGKSGTLSFGTTTTASQILLNANFLISQGNQENSYFKVIDQSNNTLFSLSIGGGTTVILTDGDNQQTTTSGITTEKTQVAAFGGNQYYKTRWTAVKAYFDFTNHYGIVKVGSGTYQITLPKASTGVKGFSLVGGKYYGASLVAKDYTAVAVDNRYATEMEAYVNSSGDAVSVTYTDKNSVSKTSFGNKCNGGSGNRYGTLTFASAISNYAQVSGNIVLQSGNSDGSSTYFKALDQSENELFAVRMTGNNTTSVTLTYSGNSTGTEIMTASKYVDATLGNGTSSYGNTGWISFSAYLNFVGHNGKVTIGGETYNITLPESSTAIKGYYLQSGRGYGAVLLATDYTATPGPAPAGSVTVKYVDTEGTEIATSSLPSVADLFEGETLKYTYSKYLVSNGDLYEKTADKTNASVTLTKTAQDIEVEYSKTAEGTYFFYEFDGNHTTRTDYESNGSAATSSVNVTIPEDGVYIITANCYGSASGRSAYIKKGSTELKSQDNISIYAGGTNVITGNVALNANDVITVSTSDSKSAIDYVILQKIYDVLGKVDKSSAFTQSDAYTLKKGETKVLTFTNHGYGTDGSSQTKSWYNWTIGAYDGSTGKAFTRADFWDNIKDATTGYDQAMSTDGGNTKTWLDWDKFKEDMVDATVVATLSYSVDGTYSISAVQTGHVNNYLYYVDHSVSDLTADELAIKLGVEYSWSEIISVEQTAISATIGETGWTSFASPYPLDLSGIDGGTAYYASSVGERITMTSTEATVPAGEGLLLKGTAGATVTIPIATTDGTAIEGNKLVGCTSALDITMNTEGYAYFYVLASNNGKAEFQNIKNYVETDNHTVTIPAGKAYLDGYPTVGARALNMVFEEENVTGVNTVQGSGVKVQGCYDLQGRRVSQPTKGLYIMDGKKIIIK